MIEHHITLFFMGFILYLFATIFYVFHAIFRESRTGSLATGTFLAGVILNALAIILRAIHGGYMPITNMYESISFFSVTIGVFYLIVERKWGYRILGAFVAPVTFLLTALSSSPLMPKEIAPPIPALQSHWLTLHVTLAFIGEACFVTAFGASVMYLWKTWGREGGWADRAFPDVEKLDRIAYQSIAIGFPIFTLGALIFGAVWARTAWGDYWSWDPKEVWSLVTWFAYALYLHSRLVLNWKGVRTAIIAIVGFAFAMFTFFGVNYLISGLHSYT